MPRKSPLAQALHLAATKYAGDPVIMAIAAHLELQRKLAEMEAKDHTSALYGYRRALAGQSGYSQLQDLDLGLFSGIAREASRLHQVMAITDVLIIALRALGERIDE